MRRKKWTDLVADSDAWHHEAFIRFLPNRVSNLHDHDFSEVFWVEQGVGRHCINGEARQLYAGDLIFIRPKDCHRLEVANNQGFTFVNLAYPDCVRREMMRRWPDEAIPWLGPSTGLPARARLNPATLPTFRRRVERLARSPNSRLALEYVLTGLLESVRLAAKEQLPPMPDWLKQACEHVKQPEVFSMGVAGFVKAAGRCHEHVSRSMRVAMGCTPSQHVNTVRMDYAARELRVTTRPIADIAMESGINNLSHFYALFRETHGDTPRAYRLRYESTAV